MTERSKALMSSIWEKRNSGADTEEKLVAAILSLVPNYVIKYNTQNQEVVLDHKDLISLSEELCNE